MTDLLVVSTSRVTTTTWTWAAAFLDRVVSVVPVIGPHTASKPTREPGALVRTEVWLTLEGLSPCTPYTRNPESG